MGLEMSSTEKSLSEQHQFGDWRFNANTGDLSNGQITTHLEPQVAKLLAYFLAHQNTLTSRDELMDSVWDGRIVSDDAINRCISILRQILTPDDRNAYIETVVRRGFISHFPPVLDEAPAAGRSSQRKKQWLLLLLAGLFAVILYNFFGKPTHSLPTLQETQHDGPPMVAVLPFTTSGMAGDSEFFANGMHDDLLTQLAQLQSIRVISRTSVLEYRDSKRNMREIGAELGADAILEGGIQRNGDQIRINVQLIDAHTDEHLWAGQYDRELLPANIFAIQSEIAGAITHELHANLTEQDAAQLRVIPTDNMAAYRAYHRAMKIRDIDSSNSPEYVIALEEAVALDPGFVRAWVELAGALSLNNFGQQDPDSIQRVEQILEKIQALAPHSADYLIAQAFYTYYILRNYNLALQLINHAQTLRPSDERVWELKGWILRRLGDYEGKIESVRMARTLDPRNHQWTSILVMNLLLNHQYDEAMWEIENADYRSMNLSVLHSYLQQRDQWEAARGIESLKALENEYGVNANPRILWEAYIAARDFGGAEESLAAIESASPDDDDWAFTLLLDAYLEQAITYWFLGAIDQLGPLLVQWRAKLEALGNSNEGPQTHLNLAMAFVAATEGNTEETERLIRTWRRKDGADLAGLVNTLHYACRALGMAAAISAAVECIREGLVEPSFVMPFMEPFLPYYDSIRDESEFIALLNDI